jgi:hypothetical protein
MTVKLDLTAEIEAGLLAQAHAHGLSLEAYLDRVLQNAARDMSTGQPDNSPRKSRLWELRKGLSLGDISIHDLINEGRE